jgi:hypothetical protein
MSTIISREQFLQDVRTEVEALKANATQEEVGKLDIETFNPMKMDKCIYGQMTGSCENERAKKLMDKACVRVTNNKDSRTFENKNFDDVSDNINGVYKRQTWVPTGWHERDYGYLSMVETYIFLSGSNPKNIMDYLKGEVETLELPLI